MADMTSIIAGIDGYRRYEQNRALDVNNEAQALQNRQAGKIMDLKSQLEALQTNHYAKYNIWDPVGRRQQLLSEDDQLKIASKWASSIKNLAPENREAGYKQFLRAMPGLGIDVSDMPQGYDEGYINMIADLGIGTETRYQNEQQNSRLERQIEANREARQDEFDKRLAAFDYENRYKSDREKSQLAEKDDFVRGLGLDDMTTNRLLAANRGISVPEDKGMDDRMLQRLTEDPQDETARTYFANQAKANKYINSLKEPEKMPFKDAMSGLKYAKESGANVEGLNSLAERMNYPELKFEDLSDFDRKIAAYNKSKQEFPDMPEAYHRKQAGLLSAEDEALFAGMKAGAEEKAKQPFLLERDNNASGNRITESTISNAQQNDYKQQQMQFEDALKRDYETWQKTLPVDDIIKADQIAEKLNQQGFNVSANDILFNQYRKDVLDNMKQQTEIEKTKAETEKTRAETPYAGLTEAAKNYVFTQQNPEAVNSPAFKADDKYIEKESKLRTQFDKLSEEARVVAVNLEKVRSAAEDKTPAGDVAMVYGFMKMLDPNSSVREGEYANAQNATGVPGQIANLYNKVVSGTKLSETQRKDFLKQAENVYKSELKQYNRYKKEYRRMAEEQGLNPDNVVIDVFSEDEVSDGNLPVGESVSISGFKIERID